MGSSSCIDTAEVVPSHITYANVSTKEIEHQRRQAKEQCLNFGVQLEVVGPVLSILAIPTSLTLATGLADGRLILYDLDDLQVFHIAFPPCENAPLIQFCVQEPTDDPRANLYVWSLHASEEGAVAVMHALIFESKVVEDSVCFYDVSTSSQASITLLLIIFRLQTFNSCHVRLTMPMYDPGSLPLNCQSISKVTNQGDEIVKLCVIAWMAHNKVTHTIIFDLNQWYKAQMPSICNWRHFPNYIAAFEADSRPALSVCLSEESLVPFNSIQRPEEHFHPNSLSFGESFGLNRRFFFIMSHFGT
jgi:beta-propeller of ELYS nucleoporin